MSNSHDVGTVYSQTCIKRSPLRLKKGDLYKTGEHLQ